MYYSVTITNLMEWEMTTLGYIWNFLHLFLDILFFKWLYMVIHRATQSVFGSFGLSTKEPYTIMLCSPCIIVPHHQWWQHCLCTPLLATGLDTEILNLVWLCRAVARGPFYTPNFKDIFIILYLFNIIQYYYPPKISASLCLA